MSATKYRVAVAVTPHATNDNAYDAFYVGAGGDVALRAENSAADVTLVGCLIGVIYPIKTLFIRATSTTATSIVGLQM